MCDLKANFQETRLSFQDKSLLFPCFLCVPKKIKNQKRLDTKLNKRRLSQFNKIFSVKCIGANEFKDKFKASITFKIEYLQVA